MSNSATSRQMQILPESAFVLQGSSNPMALKRQLSSETEAKILERAAASGQDVEAFVLQAVADKLAEAEVQPSLQSRNGREWAEKLRACIDLHPIVTHFVDDSRESV